MKHISEVEPGNQLKVIGRDISLKEGSFITVRSVGFRNDPNLIEFEEDDEHNMGIQACYLDVEPWTIIPSIPVTQDLLERIDEQIAFLEDISHGEQGKEVTSIRKELQKLLKT